MKKLPILFLTLICACAPLRAQTFNLQTSREPITSLDGLWRFHTGDNPAWASPTFDDSQWPLLHSDETWTAQGYPNYGGYAWYRFRLQVPDGSKPVALVLTTIYCGYQVYANGKLIGSAGSTTPTASPVVNFAPMLYRLPSGTGPQIFQIAVRVWNFQPYASAFDTGGPQRPGSLAGDPFLLHQRLQADRNASALIRVNLYAYCLITALVGLTVLVLFLLRPVDREYLWFAIYILAAGTNAALAAENHLLASLPFSLIVFLDAATNAMSVTAGLLFFSLVLRRRRSWLWWLACIAMALSPFGVILTWIQWTAWGVGHVVGTSLMLPAYLWIITALAVCAY
ncbi:MAG TPA: beta galactosidase jelly roll domain-containing protein, partial [Terracidiphilus sp.]|nr:beta galactosidase jelly roll domain-containing protein [Terracidiphilus sp.]